MVKSYQVVVLPQAIESLKEINNFLRRTASDSIAKKVQKEILTTIKKLEKLPASHSILSEISNDKIIYRRVLQWSYRIIFTIHEDKLQVLVVDIDHSAEDPQKLIDKFKSP